MTTITDELAAHAKIVLGHIKGPNSHWKNGGATMTMFEASAKILAEEALAKYEAAKAQEPSDLVWWVRDAANSICGQTGATTHQEKLHEAADRIEALEAGTVEITNRKSSQPNRSNP